ncbi:MAG: hypothetical protein ACI9HK_004549, partial [Pirellulaceae bacterium]
AGEGGRETWGGEGFQLLRIVIEVPLMGQFKAMRQFATTRFHRRVSRLREGRR